MKYLSSTILVVIVSTLLGTTGAHADVAARTVLANAANSCIPSRPAYEGAVRKRPLAVQNEGDTDAFVTCAFANDGTVYYFQMAIQNQTPVPKNVTCTAVNGSNNIQTPAAYMVKTAFLAPNSYLMLTFDGSDFGGTAGNPLPSDFIGANCILIPGTGIGETAVVFEEEIGN